MEMLEMEDETDRGSSLKPNQNNGGSLAQQKKIMNVLVNDRDEIPKRYWPEIGIATHQAAAQREPPVGVGFELQQQTDHLQILALQGEAHELVLCKER